MSDVRRAERIQHLTVDNGLIVDISESGIAVRTEEAMRLVRDAEVQLELTAGAIALSVKAKVVYVKKADDGTHQAGFHYHMHTGKLRETLEEMVDAYSKGVPIHVKIVR